MKPYLYPNHIHVFSVALMYAIPILHLITPSLPARQPDLFKHLTQEITRLHQPWALGADIVVTPMTTELLAHMLPLH